MPPPAPEPATSTAAFEFAECMRDNGIEDFADPQIRADGDYFLEPPAGVSDDELTTAETACEHILGPPSAGPAANTVTSPPGGSRSCRSGDCQCSDGSAFSFWVREANPDKVVFYLQDGGACFSAETCAPGSDLYQTTIADGATARRRNLRLRQCRATRSPITPSSTSPTAQVTCTSATPSPNMRPDSRCSTRATSTVPPPSTTSPQRFPTPPRSSSSARAPARSPRRCTAA